MYAVHQTDVDPERAVEEALAARVVAAATDADGQIVLARETQGGDHVGIPDALGDRQRLAVEHRVPKPPLEVPVRGAGLDKVPVELVCQGPDASVGDSCSRQFERLSSRVRNDYTETVALGHPGLLAREPLQVAYSVPDLAQAATAWARTLGAGPFFLASDGPLPLDEVTCPEGHGAWSHTSCLGQWGPLLVELMQHHSAEPASLADQLGVGRHGLHHVAITVPDPASESARLEGARMPADRPVGDRRRRVHHPRRIEHARLPPRDHRDDAGPDRLQRRAAQRGVGMGRQRSAAADQRARVRIGSDLTLLSER